MSAPPVLWVLVPDLGRSGVPTALVRLLRWQAAARPDAAEVHVIAGRGGALEGAVAAASASLTCLAPAERRGAAATVAVTAAQLGRPASGAAVRDRWYRLATRRLPRPDVVLVQGAGAWTLAESLAPSIGTARLVAHLHELEIGLGRSVDREQRRRLASEPDAVLAVSRPVADLAEAAGTRPDRITIVAGSVDDPPGGWDRTVAPAAEPALLAIGEAGWRKGTDRMDALAHELARTRPDVRCHWIGAPPESSWSFAVGAHGPLRHHPASADPWSVVAAPAALVVPSREDPLPLVVLEAASRGLAVVAAPTGGLVDLLGDGRGWLVPGPDLEGLVAAVTEVVAEPERAAGRAQALRHHVHQHHRTEVVGPRWLDAVLGRS